MQVDPIKVTLKPPRAERLKPKCDELLSNFAFKFNLRCYIKGWAANTLKVVPQNSIRFVAYETLKTMMSVETKVL